jgi:hypothetical protein
MTFVLTRPQSLALDHGNGLGFREQNRYRAEASLVGKKCARMSADFRCGRHVESNQTRGHFIGVNMAEYEKEPLKVL